MVYPSNNETSREHVVLFKQPRKKLCMKARRFGAKSVRFSTGTRKTLLTHSHLHILAAFVCVSTPSARLLFQPLSPSSDCIKNSQRKCSRPKGRRTMAVGFQVKIGNASGGSGVCTGALSPSSLQLQHMLPGNFIPCDGRTGTN